MKQLSVLLLVVAVCIAAWFVWSVDPVPPMDSLAGGQATGQQEAALAEAESAALSAVNAGDETQPDREEQVPESASDWVVRGRVDWGLSTEPAEDIRVRCSFHPGAEGESEASFERIVRSDAQGKFRCSMPAPTELGMLRAYAMTGTRGETDAERALLGGGDSAILRAGDPAPQEFKLRVYHSDFPVVGRVTGPGGKAVAGATIQSAWTEALTDAEGKYELFTLRERDSVQLFARAPGLTQVEKWVERTDPEKYVVDFELTAAARVSGVVRDQLGSPIEGVELRVFSIQNYSVFTNAQGQYVYDHVDPTADRITMFASKDGYLEARADPQPGLRTEIEQDFVLEPGALIQGTVVDEFGEPVVGASLYIGFSSSAVDRHDARSDENGVFQFEQIPFGQQKLVTQAKGFAADRQILVLDPGELRPDPLRIELGRGRTLAGQAVDTAGNPLAEVHISPRHFDEYVQGRIQTDQVGRFQFEHMPLTDLALEFYGERVEREKVKIADHATDALRIELGSLAYFCGRVVDATTREAITDFQVSFVRVNPGEGEQALKSYSGDWYPAKSFHSESGEWVYDRAPVGSVTGVKIMAPGYATGFLPRVVASTEANPQAAIAALHAEHRLVGVVMGGDPLLPIAGAAVSVDAQDPDGRSGYLDDRQRWAPTLTDAAGRFSIGGLSATEDYRLRVAAIGFAELIEAPLQLRQGSSETERQIELSLGASVHGRALNPDGSPLVGQPVHMVPYQSSSVDRNRAAGVVTDGEGRFEISGLEVGKFWIGLRSASEFGELNHLQRILEVVDDQPIEVVLQAHGAAALAGEIRFSGELPNRVRVQLHPNRFAAPEGKGNEMLAQTVFAEGGRFRFEGVSAGSYILMASFSTQSDRYVSLRTTVMVGEVDQLDLVLEPQE